MYAPGGTHDSRQLSAGLHRQLGLLTRELKNVNARHPRTIHTPVSIIDDLVRQLTELRAWLTDKLDADDA